MAPFRLETGVPSGQDPSSSRIFAALALMLGAASSEAGAEEYRLGPQDRVRLKVYEWRASRDMIFEWTALNDQFTVSAAGTLALPFIGEIQAAGVAPGELASAIGHRLKTQMGLGQAPNTSVEVVQFRPFYVVGEVTQPGEFPYRPELTVLKALSLAGGLRLKDDDLLRLPREVIAARGELSIYDLQIGSLLVRKARLESELAGSENIAFPAELTARQDDGTLALLMQQEQTIFKARREA